MSSKRKKISIISLIVLTISLIINIGIFVTNTLKNNTLINDINSIKNDIIKNENKKEELTNNLNKTKDEKKDKILEYGKWIKWTKEIEEKIK